MIYMSLYRDKTIPGTVSPRITHLVTSRLDGEDPLDFMTKRISSHVYIFFVIRFI